MNRKKGTAFVLTAILAMQSVGLAGGLAEEAVFQSGTYEATVDSVAGPMTVAVTVSENRIEEIKVLENNDTDGLRDVPVEKIPKAIVENQSVNVDTVAGATLTSVFLRNAVRDALMQATDNLDAFQEKVTFTAPAQIDMDVDLVIVGGGIAGMSAVATAAANGLNVVLVEQLGFLGGDALVSNQYALGEAESWNGILEDFNAYGVNVSLVEYKGYKGAAQSMQLEMPDKGNKSTLNALVTNLREIAEKNGALILTDTKATGLLSADGTVNGITAQPKGQESFKINAKAVLLATGGFSYNKDLIAEYLPFAVGARYAGVVGAYGDAIEWVKEFDGQTANMAADRMSFYSVSPKTGYMAEFSTSSNIRFIDKNGDLITEDTTYNTGTMASYLAVGNETYYTISSETDIVTGSVMAQEAYEHMVLAKSVKVYNGMDALVELGLTNVKETLTKLGYEEDEVFYVGEAVAGVYGTNGGLVTDAGRRVLNNSNEVIPGLYAAGEVAYDSGKIGPGFRNGHLAVESVLADIAEK